MQPLLLASHNTKATIVEFNLKLSIEGKSGKRSSPMEAEQRSQSRSSAPLKWIWFRWGFAGAGANYRSHQEAERGALTNTGLVEIDR